jgi:hypothetical protein
VRSSTITVLIAMIGGLTFIGCGWSRSTGNPGAPTPMPPVLPPGTVSVKILSGNDHQAVSGAHVVISGQEYSTDQNGFVTPLPKTSAGADVDVEAVGYLPRATRVDSNRNQTITLWPIAGDAEADAIRHMVFGRFGKPDLLYAFYLSGAFYLTIPSADDATWAAWKAGAADFGSMFGINYVIGSQEWLDQNEIVVVFGTDHSCTPAPLSGFCWITPNSYKDFAVATDRATDPVTIRRVLASQFLGPNPFPGLLNSGAPADTLSPFEMQTIRMILQRPLPQLHWPDNDRQ